MNSTLNSEIEAQLVSPELFRIPKMGGAIEVLAASDFAPPI
jgi:hypothetical protein